MTDLENLFVDVRYVLRRLRQSPAFTLTAILTIAVGIGANLTSFAIAKAIFWEPIPVSHPEQLLAIYNRAQQGTGYYTGVAYREFLYYREHNKTLNSLAVYLRIPLHLKVENETESVIGETVTSEFFSALPVRTILGRTLGSSTDDSQELSEIVLSYRFWQNRFNGDPNVLGTTLRVEGLTYTVVGVVEPDFSSVLMDWQQPPQFWVSMGILRRTPFSAMLSNWKANGFMVVGRTKPEVSVDQAAAEFGTLAAQISHDPEMLRAWEGRYDLQMIVLPIQRARFFPGYREVITNYVGVVGIVMAMMLLIASLNLANLVIARAAERQREWAVRAALGAGRLRLARQSILETAIICLGGAAGSMLVAPWVWHILPLYGRPFRVALPPNFNFDLRVFGINLALVFATTVLIGLWPSLRAWRVNPNLMMKDQSAAKGVAGFRVRSALIASQVAIALILLVGAGLLVQTVENARAADRLGQLRGVGTVSPDLDGPGYSAAKKTAFAAEALQRVRALPGVARASYGSDALAFAFAGRLIEHVTCRDQTIPIDKKVAASQYFDILNMPVLAGRDFSDRDNGDSSSTVVNETLARQCWPNLDPLGQKLTYGDATLQVVGVIRDTNTRGFRSDIVPTVYTVPMPRDMGILLIRTASDPFGVFPLIRETIRQIDPNVPVTFASMQEHIEGSLSQERLASTLCVTLGAIALGLTLMGLYGIVTLSVTARTREIGIRMAIGAQSHDVLKLVLKQTIAIVGVGLFLGIAGSIALTGSINAMLYGVRPLDIASFGFAAVCLTTCAVVATLIPARRASRIDPLSALRHD